MVSLSHIFGFFFAGCSSVWKAADYWTRRVRFSNLSVRRFSFEALLFGSNIVGTAPVIIDNLPESPFLRSSYLKCKEQIRGSDRFLNLLSALLQNVSHFLRTLTLLGNPKYDEIWSVVSSLGTNRN